MTKLPSDNRNVKGRGDIPAYPDPDPRVCVHPSCGHQVGLERHHCWRRSALAGPFHWVELWDGTVVGNVVDLCQEHHDLITTNKARIVWNEELQKFCWDDLDDGDLFFLSPQPPFGAQPPVPPPLHAALSSPLSSPGVMDERSVEPRTEPDPEVCPTCHQKVKRKREHKAHVNEDKPIAVRRTKAIAVPLWARTGGEDGVALIDELLDQAAEILKAMDLNVPPAHKGRDYGVTIAVFTEFVSRNRELLGEDK